MRIEVSWLSGCPYRRANKLHPPELRYAFATGSEKHRRLQEWLRKRGFETEYRIEYEWLGVKIAGKVDAIKHRPPLVIEIKSRNMGVSGLRQLLLYRDLLFLVAGREYRPALIIYNGDRYRLEANFLWVPPLLSIWREVKKVLAWVKARGELPRVRCDDCAACSARSECKPVMAWTPYRISRTGEGQSL